MQVAALHRATPLPRPSEAVFPEAMQRKEFLCSLTQLLLAVGLSRVFGLGQKLLCDLQNKASIICYLAAGL